MNNNYRSYHIKNINNINMIINNGHIIYLIIIYLFIVYLNYQNNFMNKHIIIIKSYTVSHIFYIVKSSCNNTKTI